VPPYAVNYDRVGLQIMDNSTLITRDPVEYEQSASGATYDQSWILPNGNYRVRGYLRDSTDTIPVHVGPTVFFTVGNTSALGGSLVNNVNASNTHSQFSTTSPVLGDVPLYFVDPATFLPADLSEIFRTRFPFTYLYEGVNLIALLAFSRALTVQDIVRQI